MCPDIITPGDLLVEIMRKARDIPLYRPDEFAGPFPSGASSIFIDAAARLGASSGIIGVVGGEPTGEPDDFAKLLLDRFKRDGVDTSHVRILPGYTTSTTFVSYRSDGSRKFLYHLRHGAAGQLCPGDIDPEYVSKAKMVHIMGSNLAVSKSSCEACYKAVEIAKEEGIRVSFDPNLRPELLTIEEIRRVCAPVLRSCSVLLPSEEEAMMLTGDKDPRVAVNRLLEKGPEMIALKMGKSGSMIATKEGRFASPAYEVEEVDPTGAGDCYDAAFDVGLLDGMDLERLADFANAVGALAVTKLGPMEGAPFRGEVERLMKARARL